MSGVQILSSQSFVLLYFLCFLHVYIFTFCLQICIFYFFLHFWGIFVFVLFYFVLLYFLYFCTFSFDWTVHMNFHAKFELSVLLYLHTFLYFLYFCNFLDYPQELPCKIWSLLLLPPLTILFSKFVGTAKSGVCDSKIAELTLDPPVTPPLLRH